VAPKPVEEAALVGVSVGVPIVIVVIAVVILAVVFMLRRR
jgi:hypothetical protein